jgi:hypothetical protein
MDRNIFEAASRKLGKKKAKDTSVFPSPPPLPQNPKSEDTELMQMVDRMHQMQQDLDNQLIELRQKGKAYHIDVDKYIEDSKKSFPKDLEKAHQEQQELFDRIGALFPPEACIKKNPKTQEKLAHERKAKMLGLRKKWIPIH